MCSGRAGCVSACGRTVTVSSQLGWSEVSLVRQAASRWTRLCIVYVCVCVCSRDWTRSHQVQQVALSPISAPAAGPFPPQISPEGLAHRPSAPHPAGTSLGRRAAKPPPPTGGGKGKKNAAPRQNTGTRGPSEFAPGLESHLDLDRSNK
jgi:hypothetical protein